MTLEEIRATTTTTKFAACSFGGPIATVTLPLPSLVLGSSSSSNSNSNSGSHGSSGGSSTANSSVTSTEIRIMSNSGASLCSIPFPPKIQQQSKGSSPKDGSSVSSTSAISSALPEDILTIGFTSRWVLLVVLRDGTCLAYDLRGRMIIPPFPTIQQSQRQGPVELIEANVFDGGVAVLSTTMHSALIEILDEHDDPSYFEGRHVASRRVCGRSGGDADVVDAMFNDTQSDSSCPAPHFAIVTPLPTASYASYQACRYCSILSSCGS